MPSVRHWVCKAHVGLEKQASKRRFRLDACFRFVALFASDGGGREARRPMARHYRAKTTGVRQWSRMPSRAPRWRAATGKGAAARVGSPDGRASRPTATGLYGDGVRPRCASMGRNGGRARCPYRAARVMRGCTGDGVAQRGTAMGHGGGMGTRMRDSSPFATIRERTATVLSPETFPSVAHNPECQLRNRRNLDNRVFCRNAVRLHRPG